MITDETFMTIVFLSNKGHGIDDMFFSMGFQIIFFCIISPKKQSGRRPLEKQVPK